MKIESEVFIFNKKVQLENLPMNELQKQYLSYLTAQDSIEQLAVRSLTQGWLVNFQELFNLVEKLVKSGAVLNLSIVQYFKNISQVPHPAVPTTSTASVSTSPSEEITQKILELPFFRSLPLELAKVLIQKSTIRRYPVNSAICKTDERDRNMYVLFSGQAAIYKLTSTGRQFISVIGSKGIFGEASFLTGCPKSADILATQSCEVLVVPYQPNVLDPILNQNVAHQITQRFWIQNALLNSEFFKKIPADCLDALTFVGKIITLKNDQILFNQNDQSLAAYLIIQGQIKVVQNSKLISNLTQGSFFGEISLTMTNGVRTATTSSHGSTTLLEINRNDFYLLLSQNLVLAKEIQNLAFQRLSRDQQR